MSFRDLIKKKKADGGDIVKSILAEKGARIEYIVIRVAKDTYNYFYVLMSEVEYQRMHMDITLSKKITPSEYGFVIYQGFGNEPHIGIEEAVFDIFKN